ncbi:BglG family transcription antiterminator [Enterococcus faecium]|uniref:BglG family transcription antiterminator n=1 Tax=Enterococcus faecium TaxID=1352 RepID=UPI000A345830|nr:PTS sugar transporter subunit IIA [Enterococcus faecium]OTN91765.1 PTS system ascorbate-specific transporter subunit IIA [Enterococcus faecium]
MNYKISYLLKTPREISLEKAAEIIEVNTSEAVKQLTPFAEYVDDTHIRIKKFRAIDWAEKFLDITRFEAVYTEQERRDLLYLMVYSTATSVSVFHFQDFLQVSKGTVLSDIKKIRNELEVEDCQLSYTRKTGFRLLGSEAILRREAKNRTARLMQSLAGRFGLTYLTATLSIDYYAKVRDLLDKTISLSDLRFAPNRMDELAYYLSLTTIRIGKTSMELVKDTELLASLAVTDISRQVLTGLGYSEHQNSEIIFFSLCLASIVEGDVQEPALDFLLECSSEVIHRMEFLMAVEFASFRELLMNVFYHLVPAYFRISYSFYLPNVMIDQIKHQYASIYEMTRKALLPLERRIGKSIPEEEIGFFTILFGGEIRKADDAEERNRKIRAVIVCPSGISSSLILKSELQQLFPMIFFTETNSADRLHEVDETSYDIIFSTVPLTLTDKKKSLYVLHPIMTDLEKNQLINQVQRDWLIPGFSMPSAQELLSALLPYIELKEGVDEEKLYQVLNRKMNKLLEKKEDQRPMLSELLTEEMIQLSDQPKNWQEAITFAAQPLLSENKIEESYIKAMIERVEQYGAFIHIGDHIALPHARPEDGVNEVGMSLLKLQQPVDLLDDPAHPISLFICLAAIDNEAHLRALANLTKLLSNKQNLQDLLHASTKEEILAIIRKGDE